MHAHRSRRLIATACTLALIAAPSIWIYREIRQQHLNFALIAAIKNADANTVESLLAAGADPNTRDTPETHEPLLQRLMHLLRPGPVQTESLTALIVLLDQRRVTRTLTPQTLKIAKALIAKGANVNISDKSGYTPINAIFWPYIGDADTQTGKTIRTQLLSALLAAGANPERTYGHTLCTPLMAACRNGEADRVLILLDHGANIESTGLPGCTPLTMACSFGRAGIAALLLDHGANPNPAHSQWSSPLSAARKQGYTDIVNLLIAHGGKQ